MDCIGRTWIFLSYWDCIVIPWGHLWLLVRKTGPTAPSLLRVYVLQREGMSGALTCIWHARMYLHLSYYLPLSYLFWKGNKLFPPLLSCEQNQLNPLLERGCSLVIQHFTSSQIRDVGNVIILMLWTGLVYEAVVIRPSIHLKCILFENERQRSWCGARQQCVPQRGRWMEGAMASGNRMCRNQGRSYEAKCCPLPALISPHLPCPFGYLLPRSCLPAFVLWAFLPAGGTWKTLPAHCSPPSLPQAVLPAATAALARTQLAGNEEQEEGRAARNSIMPWQLLAQGRQQCKETPDRWMRLQLGAGEHLGGAWCHMAAGVGMG